MQILSSSWTYTRYIDCCNYSRERRVRGTVVVERCGVFV